MVLAPSGAPCAASSICKAAFSKNNLYLLRQSSFGPEWWGAFTGSRQRGLQIQQSTDDANFGIVSCAFQSVRKFASMNN